VIHGKHGHGSEKIHYHIACDGCNQSPLIGDRYKCETCENFDFCSKCYKEGKHEKNHKFKLIESRCPRFNFERHVKEDVKKKK